MMLRNLLIACIVCFSFTSISAQKLFSPEQEKEFAQVYLTQINIASSTAQKQTELLKEYQVNFSRYREILDAQSNNKAISLQANESTLVKEMLALNEAVVEAKEKKVIAELKSTSLDIEDYRILLKKYNSDRKFAERIKTHFKS